MKPKTEATRLVWQRRQQWVDEWLQHALDLIPEQAAEITPDIDVKARHAVVEVLSKLEPSSPEPLVNQSVSAAVNKLLAPWRRALEIVELIERAVEDGLLRAGRGVTEASEWRGQARQACLEALRPLPEHASIDQVEQTVRAAVDHMAKADPGAE